jgi:hypothetical protein
VVVGLLRWVGWGGLARLVGPVGALVLAGWATALGAVLIQEGGLWLAGRLGQTGANGHGSSTSIRPGNRTSIRPSNGTLVTPGNGTSIRPGNGTPVTPGNHTPTRPGNGNVIATRLFLGAYVLRVLIVLPTHYIAAFRDGNGALYSDDYTNDLVGEWLVRIGRGEGISIFPGHQHLLDGVYPYMLMATYAVFGYAPLLPKLFNSALAALCAVLVFEMARRIFRLPAALLAAVGAALLPSLVVWSVASLKETLVLFAALLGLRVVQFLSTVPSRSNRIADALVFMLAVLTLLLDLRWTTTAILLGLLAAVYVARRLERPGSRPLQLGLIALAGVVILSGGLLVVRGRTSTRPLNTIFEDVALQIRHRRAQEAASARSQLRSASDVYSATGSALPASEAASDAEPFTVMGDVLEPLAYGLLAPAPWQAETKTELAASGEMLVWYVLLVASFFAWRAEPRQRLFVVCLAGYGIANWLVLATTEGNLGNLLRHRLLLDPTLLILGGAGLDWLWVRAGWQRRYSLSRWRLSAKRSLGTSTSASPGDAASSGA